MLRILGKPTSINVRKVLWTAAEARASFVHEPEWGAERPTRTPEFLALNPNGFVPVLVTDDGVLWESNAICRYLAAGRDDLLPQEPFARAQVEKWMDWQVSELNPAWSHAFMALVRKSPDHLADPAAIARSVRRWNELIVMLEHRLAETGAYIAGQTFTLADIVIGLSLQRWLLTPLEERPPTPNLLAYRQRLLARPAAAGLDPSVP